MKYKKKKIETTLTVLLMKGKTIRDMYVDFFGGRLPKNLDGTEVITYVMIQGETVSYEAYKKFSGCGATRDFLDMFEFKYITRNKLISGDVLRDEVNKVIPFDSPEYVRSYINDYTLGAGNFNECKNIKVSITTYTWSDTVTEEDIKKINKDNARRLRKKLVSLPSVQGVPYSCTYREDDVAEQKCEV